MWNKEKDLRSKGTVSKRMSRRVQNNQNEGEKQLFNDHYSLEQIKKEDIQEPFLHHTPATISLYIYFTGQSRTGKVTTHHYTHKPGISLADIQWSHSLFNTKE